MDLNYNKNLSQDMLFMKNREDNEKRHQCDTLMINKDITNADIKTSLEDIKNWLYIYRYDFPLEVWIWKSKLPR